jgi:hypothetical protein
MQGDLLFLHNIVFKPDFTEDAFTSDYGWYVMECSPFPRTAVEWQHVALIRCFCDYNNVNVWKHCEQNDHNKNECNDK